MSLHFTSVPYSWYSFFWSEFQPQMKYVKSVLKFSPQWGEKTWHSGVKLKLRLENKTLRMCTVLNKVCKFYYKTRLYIFNFKIIGKVHKIEILFYKENILKWKSRIVSQFEKTPAWTEKTDYENVTLKFNTIRNWKCCCKHIETHGMKWT